MKKLLSTNAKVKNLPRHKATSAKPYPRRPTRAVLQRTAKILTTAPARHDMHDLAGIEAMALRRIVVLSHLIAACRQPFNRRTYSRMNQAMQRALDAVEREVAWHGGQAVSS